MEPSPKPTRSRRWFVAPDHKQSGSLDFIVVSGPTPDQALSKELNDPKLDKTCRQDIIRAWKGKDLLAFRVVGKPTFFKI